MSFVIFGDIFSFPDGGAATNRVYTYANGFKENGEVVHVICFTNDYMDVHEGEVDGIRYYQPLAEKNRSNNFIVRNWKKMVKHYNTYSIIRKINRSDKIIAINSCSNFLSTHVFAFLLARVAGCKMVVECNEHPLRYYQGSLLKKMQGELNFFFERQVSDGVFCISHYLVDLYRSKGFNNKKLFLVPSTVDPNRFVARGNKPVEYKYIGYFGSLSFGRDNVDLLINAFSIFAKQHHDMQLVLGGFSSEEESKKIITLTGQLYLQDRVVLLGYLSREDVLSYVSHADVLVMVRGNDLQSQASYPSKLSEFLASGKPVVTVNVGEIAMYMKDGEEVFMVEAGNVQAMADKLHYVFTHPNEAAHVAAKGKALTDTVFNYNYQAKRMIGFIHSLYSSVLPAKKDIAPAITEAARSK